MKMILLMILFSTPEKPEPHVGTDYGFGHREAPSMEVCMKRRDMTLKQLEGRLGKGEYATAFCVEVDVHGYAEGVENFKRNIGEMM